MPRRQPEQPQQPQDPEGAVEFLHDSQEETQQPSGEEDVVEVVHADALVARVAGSHRGAISYRALKDLGLGAGGIDHRVRRERLHRVHRGVYLVGHPVAAELAEQHAAVLALGSKAYVSNRTALEDYEVIEPIDGPIHVTVIGRCRRSRPGIRVHRTTRIDPEDIGLLDGHLPITSPARAILDYADTATPIEVSRAINEAHVQGLVTPEDLYALMRRTPGRRGARKVAHTLARHTDPVELHAGVEQIAYELFDDTPIRNPEANAEIAGVIVDILWREERLVVELDSRFHGTPKAVDRDRRKEAHLRKHDCELLRYSYWQVKDLPHLITAEVAARLERLRAQTRP